MHYWEVHVQRRVMIFLAFYCVLKHEFSPNLVQQFAPLIPCTSLQQSLLTCPHHHQIQHVQGFSCWIHPNPKVDLILLVPFPAISHTTHTVLLLLLLLLQLLLLLLLLLFWGGGVYDYIHIITIIINRLYMCFCCRKALEAKAALYDRLSRGEGLREMEAEDEGSGEGNPLYMVDFTKKLYQVQ